MNFVILPNLVALAVLVAVFWAISRKAFTERLHYWLAGWVLVLLHFTAEFLAGGEHPWTAIAEIIAVDTLLLAGIAFLISVAPASSRKRRFTLALAIAVPTLAYATGAFLDVSSKGFYFAALAAEIFALTICCSKQLSQNSLRTLMALVLVACATASTAWAIAAGNPDFGVSVFLAALNFSIAILYTSCYRRASVGVITTVVGFVLWGAVFPLALLVARLTSGFGPGAEAWNIPKYIVAVGMILTLFEEQIQTSRYHAYHDDLTGLPNRRLLSDRLNLALAHARRSRFKVAVFQLDLDRFKEINDTYGHRIGDLTLQEVAMRLAACVQPGDTLARSGGDEFTVISQVEDTKATEDLVAALEAALSVPMIIDDKEVLTGLSIGVALYPDDGVNADQLHAAADRAMYVVKRSSRGGPADLSLPQASLSS
ncbi:MAG TPA: GGDEF domain-containing protein [Bryocella sp.]|nr:GGDEF domain-containing protein [Bryocella sp.]